MEGRSVASGMQFRVYYNGGTGIRTLKVPALNNATSLSMWWGKLPNSAPRALAACSKEGCSKAGFSKVAKILIALSPFLPLQAQGRLATIQFALPFAWHGNRLLQHQALPRLDSKSKQQQSHWMDWAIFETHTHSLSLSLLLFLALSCSLSPPYCPAINHARP